MYFELIGDHNQSQYAHLIPMEYRDRMELPGIIAAGAALHANELGHRDADADGSTGKEELTPAGVILLSVAADRNIEALWLAVDPAYRDREIGTLLLAEAFALAGKMQRNGLTVGIRTLKEEAAHQEGKEERGEREAAGRLRSFLVSRGFTDTGISFKEWSFSPQEIALPDGEEEEEREYVPFLRLSGDAQDEVMRGAIAESEGAPFAVVRELVNPRLSFVCMEEGEPVAGILVEHIGSVVRPIVFTLLDKPGILLEQDMIRHFLGEAKDKLKGGVVIHFRCGAGIRQTLWEEELFGIPAEEKTYFAADEDAFDHAGRNVLRWMEYERQYKESEDAFPTEFTEVALELAGGEILLPAE